VQVSLIIATKGRPGPLRAALETAVRALPRSAEVIVVDGDVDRSAEGVVSDVQTRNATVEVRYIASESSTTLQRNIGLDAARGDIVVFADDDCTFEPGLFESLMRPYEDPAVVGATGRLDRPPSSRLGSDQYSRLRWLVLGGRRQGTMSSFGFRRPIVDVAQPRDVEFMPGSLMSARRHLAAQVRFDERLPGYFGYCLGEDDDFSYRLSKYGAIRYVPSARVYHHVLGWRHMDRREIDRQQVVNRAYLFHKNFPQTRRARCGFAALLTALCLHRVLNREWSGLRGLVDGIRVVRAEGASCATSSAARNS
jgi:glycosyltransferase involved in cell wall biosynthesis